MKTINDIKEEFALNHAGYNTWEHFINDQPNWKVEDIMDEVAKRYATEAIKADRERVAEESYFTVTNVKGKLISKGQRGWIDNDGNHCEISKQSIINLPIELK